MGYLFATVAKSLVTNFILALYLVSFHQLSSLFSYENLFTYSIFFAAWRCCAHMHDL